MRSYCDAEDFTYIWAILHIKQDGEILMSVLVIAEHDNHQLNASTLSTLSAAKQLSDEIHVLVAGSNASAVVEALTQTEAVKQILYCDNPCFVHALAEDLSALMLPLVSNYSHILAPATTFGKNFLPRLSALLDLAPITDVIAIESHDTFRRPIYAGNVIATLQSTDKIKLMTIRSTTFEAASIR